MLSSASTSCAWSSRFTAKPVGVVPEATRWCATTTELASGPSAGASGRWRRASRFWVPYVKAVEPQELLAGDETDPEAEGHARVAQVVLESGRDLEPGLLQDVGGVDPTLQARVHAQVDHPAQTVPVLGEQVAEHHLAIRSRGLQGLQLAVVGFPLAHGPEHTCRANPT